MHWLSDRGCSTIGALTRVRDGHLVHVKITALGKCGALDLTGNQTLAWPACYEAREDISPTMLTHRNKRGTYTGEGWSFCPHENHYTGMKVGRLYLARISIFPPLLGSLEF